MPLIPFPNIPALPGVPAIPRLAGVVVPTVASVSLGLLQSIILSSYQSNTQWGVYDASGNPLGNPTAFTVFDGPVLSTSAVEFTKETRVSDFPVEKGGFASYNKVELPAWPIVTLCMAGAESDRASFLNAIDSAAGSIDLYTVVTPEIVYSDYTIERYNYQRRHDHGATLLTVELYLKEVRQVEAKYTTAETKSKINKPKDTGAEKTVDAGQVQSSEPKKSILKSGYDKVTGQ